jgi:hypothetical protein
LVKGYDFDRLALDGYCSIRPVLAADQNINVAGFLLRVFDDGPLDRVSDE